MLEEGAINKRRRRHWAMEDNLGKAKPSTQGPVRHVGQRHHRPVDWLYLGRVRFSSRKKSTWAKGRPAHDI